MPTDMGQIVRPGNPGPGEKNDAAAVEGATDVDITVDALVFTISNAVGGGPGDNLSVTGLTSGAVGMLAIHTAGVGNQALIYSIGGTPFVLETVKQTTDAGKTFDLDDVGDTPGRIEALGQKGSSDSDTSVPSWSGGVTDAISNRGWRPNPGEEHNGTWDDTKYLAEQTGSAGSALLEDFFVMEGIQVHKHSVAAAGMNNTVTVGSDEARATKCLVKMNVPNAGSVTGIRASNTGAGESRIIDRNTIWEVVKSAASVGIKTDTGGPAPDVIVYHNTVYNCFRGFDLSTAARLKNNIAQENSTDYVDSPGTSANNISEDGSSPDAAYRNKVVTFVNEGAEDFRLDITDTVAKNLGTTLDPDPDGYLNITEDNVGTPIPQGTAPDIGAFEVVVTPSITIIAPSSGTDSGGTLVVITGTDFEAAQGTGTVTFDGVAATAYGAWSDTSLTVTTPAGTAGAVDVVVTNNSGNFDISVGGYEYTAAPVPTEEDFLNNKINTGNANSL